MGKDFLTAPPMGWNSFDCYGTSVTEEELLRNAEYMAAHLKEYGWEYVVCDIQWYEPGADAYGYHAFADLCMDEYGRLIPAPNRFPSSAEGKGFGPIVEKIHQLGLKFGIHILRGIPRQAVAANTPVKGTPYTARGVAHANSICAWNTDMYGVDPGRPGAQAYYDSLMELYASWGVDYIKVDDICVKYAVANDESALAYGGDEIEMIRAAIDRSGRDMVLSLSPGPAKLECREHLKKHANMWRITNDFWDDWRDVRNMFERCREWSPYVEAGAYPDCDMLPVGHLSIRCSERGLEERYCRLTREEQRTMMTLWCMFRSPLMIGCELTDMDEWTKGLLTNKEVLNLLKTTKKACQVMNTGEMILWTSESETEKYIGVFNISNRPETWEVRLEACGLTGTWKIYDMWEKKDVGEAEYTLPVSIGTHGAALYRLKQ